MKKHLNLPEEAIVILLSESNSTAFAQIYTEYQAIVLGFAQRITKSRVVAEDITQDVFLKMWERRNVAGKIRNLRNYLLTICKHSALDWLAKSSRDRKAVEEMRYCAEEPQFDTENMLQQYEFYDLMHSAIDELPPKRKIVFTLCKIDGISYDEAAKQLNVAPGTINDHIVKGTRFVKEYLKKQNISPVR